MLPHLNLEGTVLRLLACFGMILLGAASLPSCAGALTLVEAQSLSKPELIKRVLGELGGIMIDVERPKGSRPITTAPNEPLTLQSLNFYSIAHNNYASGLCTASELTVMFDKNGRPRQYTTTQTFGFVGSVAGPPSDFQLAYDPAAVAEREKNCQAAPTTARFFIAPSASVANRAALALQAFSSEFRASGALPFDFSCKDYMIPSVDCRKQIATPAFSPTHISRADLIDCSSERRIEPAYVVPEHACLSITLNDSPTAADNILINTTEHDGNVFITSVRILSGAMKIN